MNFFFLLLTAKYSIMNNYYRILKFLMPFYYVFFNWNYGLCNYKMYINIRKENLINIQGVLRVKTKDQIDYAVK